MVGIFAFFALLCKMSQRQHQFLAHFDFQVLFSNQKHYFSGYISYSHNFEIFKQIIHMHNCMYLKTTQNKAIHIDLEKECHIGKRNKCANCRSASNMAYIAALTATSDIFHMSVTFRRLFLAVMLQHGILRVTVGIGYILQRSPSYSLIYF